MKHFHELGAALASRVSVYVPSTTDGARAAGELGERMTERAAARLSELFGGATVTGARGCWMSDKHGLITEQVNIVYANTTPEQLKKNIGDIRALAEQIKRDMRQEAVSVEIDGALYFV